MAARAICEGEYMRAASVRKTFNKNLNTKDKDLFILIENLAG